MAPLSYSQQEVITQLWSTVGLALLYVTITPLARTAWNIDSFLAPLSGFLNQYHDGQTASVFGLLFGAPL